VCNGYEPAERNRQARDLAASRRLPTLAGSDAHYLVDVGRACVEFSELTGTLTPEILRAAPRRIFQPTVDLSALHMSDSQIRASSVPRLRRLVPKPLRKLARRANWLYFQRQVAAHCQEPLRKEINV
jgi:hypothetical protein